MNLALRNLDDLSEAKAVKPPLGDCLFPHNATGLENMDRHNEGKVPHADAHPPIADTVVWHFIDEGRRIACHTPTPTPDTEQGENDAHNLNGGNTLTTFVAPGFRRPASCTARMTHGLIPWPVAATSIHLGSPHPSNDPLPIPANDNEWSEAA